MTARSEPAGSVGERAPRPDAWGRRALDSLGGAVSLLTVIPVPAAGAASLETGAAWFPVVGAGIGAAAGAVRLGGGALVGAAVSGVLAVLTLIVLTGALHVDGLADTADGLGARGGRERRLEVMRDPATGVFGALVLVFWTALMVTTVASLSGGHALRALLAACALARWAAVVHGAGTSPARRDGLGAALAVRGPELALASLLAAGTALAACGPGAGAAAIATAVLLAALSVAFARRALGGRTGDTLGATVASCELGVCLVLLAVWGG